MQVPERPERPRPPRHCQLRDLRIAAVHVYVLLKHFVDYRHVDPCRERHLHVSHRHNQPMTDVTVQRATDVREQRRAARPCTDIDKPSARSLLVEILTTNVLELHDALTD